MKGIVYTMILKLGQDNDLSLVNTASFIVYEFYTGKPQPDVVQLCRIDQNTNHLKVVGISSIVITPRSTMNGKKFQKFPT